MFTSDTDRRACLRQAIGCGCGAAFAALFGAIYEHFSHSVYSYFMIYAFVPLFVMSLVYVYFGAFGKVPPRRAARNLFTAAAGCTCVGMTAKGVVVIFGSTNRLLPIYIVIAGVTFLAAIGAYVTDRAKAKQPVSRERSDPA